MNMDSTNALYWLMLFQSTALVLRNPDKYPKEDVERLAQEYDHFTKTMQGQALSAMMNEAVKDVPDKGTAH